MIGAFTIEDWLEEYKKYLKNIESNFPEVKEMSEPEAINMWLSLVAYQALNRKAEEELRKTTSIRDLLKDLNI